MSRAPSFQVEKRGGARERLRATKVARSLHLALGGDAVTAADLTGVVLAELRPVCRRTGVVRSSAIAEAVERALAAAGRLEAAARYGAVADERRRRREWAACAIGVQTTDVPVPSPVGVVSRSRAGAAEGRSAGRN